ncbi:MAG TPA: type IV pili twitching motility protein PilT, partial [Gemmatimonadaceae bacterium]|nr:type IV pili twitching motility protein PilT [Gemmatimonadaceae bacterium]
MAKRPAPATAAPGAAPSGGGGTFNFKEVLQQLVQRNASDLHLKVGRPPTLRLHGELVPLDQPALKPEDLKSLAEQLMTPRQVKEFTDN